MTLAPCSRRGWGTSTEAAIRLLTDWYRFRNVRSRSLRASGVAVGTGVAVALGAGMGVLVGSGVLVGRGVGVGVGVGVSVGSGGGVAVMGSGGGISSPLATTAP